MTATATTATMATMAVRTRIRRISPRDYACAARDRPCIDIERAISDFSEQLRRNLGEVLALLPLPASEASIESVEHGASGYNVMLRVVRTAEEVEVQTRWKDRDGEPTVVEASHLSRTAITQELEDESGLSIEGEPQL